MIGQVNQIGSVTESIEAVKMSKRAGWGVMASHRRYVMFIMLPTLHPCKMFVILACIKCYLCSGVSDLGSLFNVVAKLRIPSLQTFRLGWQQ